MVTVDGQPLTTVVATGRTWRDHVVETTVPAGPHVVAVTHRGGRGLLSRLHVDRLGFVPPPAVAPPPAAAPAPAPAAPTPTTAPAPAPAPAAAPAPTTTPTPTAAPAPAPAPVPLDDAYEARIVQLVNAHRAAAGLGPLAVSACADRFAEDWSATMARTGAFAHRSDLGSLLSSCSASLVGENIAYGNLTADEMMRMWMDSPGHRANILSTRYTHVGVGAATTAAGRVYGTQNFLRLG